VSLHRAEKVLSTLGIGAAATVVIVLLRVWFVLRRRRKRAEALAELEAKLAADRTL
jgi:uncharacterized protein (TIGR03382 family)